MDASCCEGSFDGGRWKEMAVRLVEDAERNFLKMEQRFNKTKNLALLINQLVFFTLCENILLVKQPAVSFYTLMFFYVITYCVTYIKELVEREDWSMCINIARGSNVRHLAMTTTKIVLEWMKAVTFIITVVFMLLIFGLEKGLKNYNPPLSYLILTGTYYILTENVYWDIVHTVMDRIQFDCFENMEDLYLPVIQKGSQIVMSLIFTLICFLLGFQRIVLFSIVVNIRAKYTDLESAHWLPLRKELAKLIPYKTATSQELKKYDDVCAICLNDMTSARVTPCRHLFHGECLRRCLSQALQRCPICKSSLPVLVRYNVGALTR